MSSSRKEDHVRICLGSGVQGPGTTGFDERVGLRSAGAPLVAAQVDCKREFLGYSLDLPLMIAPMSGGWALGGMLNRVLARLAQDRGVALGLGSMRPALEDASRRADYDVKPLAGDVPVLGNLGVWQVRDPELRSRYIALCEDLGFDGLTVHVNPAHELAQPEGERDLSGVFEALDAISRESSLPVLVKEVGHGFSSDDLDRLAGIPLAGVDVAGAGGTNWVLVEAMRRALPGAPSDPHVQDLAEGGRDTLSTLLDALAKIPDRPVIAGGGIRSPEHVVKALGLGAALASMATPVLRSICHVEPGRGLVISQARAEAWFLDFERGLRELMAELGAPSLQDLSREDRVTLHA